jgi:hypothetical protein
VSKTVSQEVADVVEAEASEEATGEAEELPIGVVVLPTAVLQ